MPTEPTGLPAIIPAQPSDASAIADLIAEAFTSLEVAAWLIEPPGERRKVLAANFEIYVSHALTYGTVDVTVDGSAAAVWFPREDQPLPPPIDYDRRLAEACGPWTDRFQILDDLFDQHHPHQPHHHLAFLAVHPHRQGRGIGTLLLRYRLDLLDANGSSSAYLEASSQRSRRLYLRHGFTDLDHPFHLPDGPPFWPMMRRGSR